MNYRNDLDECLTYFELLFGFAQSQNIVFWVAQLTLVLHLIIRQQGDQTTRELLYNMVMICCGQF